MRNPTRTDILASLKAARHALRRLEAAGQTDVLGGCEKWLSDACSRNP